MDLNPSPENMCADASETKPEGGRRTRMRRTHIPQDLFFDILSHVPAIVLLDVMRHVCREWDLMIRSLTFIHQHLRNSSSGIIIQEIGVPKNSIHVEMRRGNLEICKLECRFEVRTSCNGLVLGSGSKNLYLANPLINQWASCLPPPYDQVYYSCDVFLTFVEASREYKLVLVTVRKVAKVALLTIGVDKVWRHIHSEHLLSFASRGDIATVVSGAYVHLIASSFVLTLNVETEVILWFPLPRPGNIRRTFLPMGNSLSVVHVTKGFIRDVWEMNPETGEWTMLLKFDLKPIANRFRRRSGRFRNPVIPFGWLADREVLLFSSSHAQSHCVVYNIETRKTQRFELIADAHGRPHSFHPHVNSFVSLEEIFPVK